MTSPIIGANDDNKDKYVIRSFKLISGEEIVADSARGEEEGEKGFFIKKPLTIVLGQHRETGQPIPMPMDFMLTSNFETVEFFLPDSKYLVKTEDVREDIRSVYIRITTGLDTSGSAGLSEAEAMAKLRKQVEAAARGAK